MKKALIITLAVITLPFTSVAYIISNIVKMNDWEDVPSPAELIRECMGSEEE